MGELKTDDDKRNEADDGLAVGTFGSTARSPWHLPLRAWWTVLKRCWVMNGYHNLSLLAAGVAFYTFLAIAPLLASTILLYGLIGDEATVARHMQTLITIVPPQAATMLEDQLSAIVRSNSGVAGIALLVNLALAIFGARRAATGLVGALNIINEEVETRGFIQLTMLTLGLTVGAVIIAIVGVSTASVFAYLQTVISDFGVSGTGKAIKVLTWAVAIAFASIGFALIARFGPDRRSPRWQWLTPGSLLSTFLWIAVSFGFSYYVAQITNYNATYGSLAAIVVFLMWLFLSSYVLLLGALLNAEAERQTREDTTIGPDRPPGSRGATMADTHALDAAAQYIDEKRRFREADKIAAREAVKDRMRAIARHKRRMPEDDTHAGSETG
jgi:membrane protein